METQKEFLFDVKLFASLRIKTKSGKEARAILGTLLDCASVNFGAIDGEPVVGEASMDGEADLMEVVEVETNEAACEKTHC